MSIAAEIESNLGPAPSDPVAVLTPEGNQSKELVEIPKNNNRLYLRNIDSSVTEEQLKDWMITRGLVPTSVLVPTKTVRRLTKKVKKPFGIAFIEFDCEVDAQKAIGWFDGRELSGKIVGVKYAIPYEVKKTGTTDPKLRGRSKKKSDDSSEDNQAKPVKDKGKESVAANDSPVNGTFCLPLLCSGTNDNKQSETSKAAKDRKPKIKTSRVPYKRRTHQYSDFAVWICNITSQTTDEELNNLLAPYRPTSIVTKKCRRRKGRKYAIVTFDTTGMQIKCMQEMNKVVLNKSKLGVKKARLEKLLNMEENKEKPESSKEEPSQKIELVQKVEEPVNLANEDEEKFPRTPVNTEESSKDM